MRPHKFVVGQPGGPAADTRPEPGRPDARGPEPRPGDLPAVEQVLQLLARAVRQFHTYPATSPLCADAVATCGKALASLERDQIVLRVTLHDLLVEEYGVGAGTIIEHELVRRLRRAGVAALTVDRAASLRHLSRFCGDLISVHDSAGAHGTLAELLTEHGVDAIVARMAYRPAIIDIGAPGAPLCDLIGQERVRREMAVSAGPAAYLYPPDKGWIRLDPTSSFTSISLVDLALLIDDPNELAAALLQITDGEPAGAGSRQTALELKFSDVSTLFASLDPRLAQIMFAKLARAVLDLEPGQRQSLLQRTILPGVLDGRSDGRVLAEFPDVDLADSLCLLLDLETAAPQVLSAALDRLHVTADRRLALAPLIDAAAGEHARTGRLRDAGERATAADSYARKLLRIDGTAPASFAEFAAFDLAVDDQAGAAIAAVRADIETADVTSSRLRCLSNLVRLEPNPDAVEGFLERVSALIAEFERASRWQDVASWLTHHRRLAEALRESRPDVAEAIASALDRFCTRERMMAIAALYDAGGERRALANALVEGYGSAVAPAAVALLDDPALQSRLRPLVQLMSEHATLLAPALAAQLDGAGTTAAMAIVRVLGLAAGGYEAPIAAAFDRGDEQVAREALRALARIGSAQAAALVSAQVRDGSARLRNAALEALCRFPPARTQIHLRELLGQRDFVCQHPDAAARLLDRAAQTDAGSLGDVLAALAPLRFRFWNPALARIGARARRMARR